MKKHINRCICVLFLLILSVGTAFAAEWRIKIPFRELTAKQKALRLFGEIYYYVSSDDYYETVYDGKRVLVDKRTNKIAYYKNIWGDWIEVK